MGIVSNIRTLFLDAAARDRADVEEIIARESEGKASEKDLKVLMGIANRGNATLDEVTRRVERRAEIKKLEAVVAQRGEATADAIAARQRHEEAMEELKRQHELAMVRMGEAVRDQSNAEAILRRCDKAEAALFTLRQAEGDTPTDLGKYALVSPGGPCTFNCDDDEPLFVDNLTVARESIRRGRLIKAANRHLSEEHASACRRWIADKETHERRHGERYPTPPPVAPEAATWAVARELYAAGTIIPEPRWGILGNLLEA